MKIFFVLLFTVVHLTNCSAQKQNYKKEIIAQIIQNQISNLGSTKIVRELNTELAEEFLNRAFSKSKFKFDSELLIELSPEEISFLSDEIKKQYGFKWTNEEIKGFEFVDSEKEITEFLLKEINNRVIMLSKPIIFRNGKYVFEYIAHFGFGQVPEYIGYRIYINKNGSWNDYVNLN
jgi:hypothetical protein